ncbi:MAG: 3-deoxy-7-phosphoheptulonate synthase [Parachlamydiales bacterium]|nr:3-deoxy-7-phosphoheptulonate synthase [Parachlamydiales bacterium]
MAQQLIEKGAHINTNNLKPQELLTPNALVQSLPLTSLHKDFIQSSRQALKNILDGVDDRLIVICGPCSIHDLTAAKDYAQRLKKLSDDVQNKIFIIMRVYMEKPRTAYGWKGLIHDPLMNGTYEVNRGLTLARELLIDLCDLQMPAAMEFLELSTPLYLADLITYGCIGARTSSSQPHRQLASSLTMPIGFKNSIDGNISLAVQAAFAAKQPQSMINANEQGYLTQFFTSGNSYSHLVLRGGGGKTNYDQQSIAKSVHLLKEMDLITRLIIDCAHDNCHKIYQLQETAFHDVLKQISKGNKEIAGIILESHLNAGNQTISELNKMKYGVSVTDACLDWQTTENLIRTAHQQLLDLTLHAVSIN